MVCGTPDAFLDNIDLNLQVVTTQSTKILPTSTTTDAPHVTPVSSSATTHHPIQAPQVIGPRLIAPVPVQQQQPQQQQPPPVVTVQQQTQPQHRFIPTFTKAQL